MKGSLRDINNDGKTNFGDTWLGDLLGFDGNFGVQGDDLWSSLKGSRRTLEEVAGDYIESKKKVVDAESKLAPETSDRPKAKPKKGSDRRPTEAATGDTRSRSPSEFTEPSPPSQPTNPSDSPNLPDMDTSASSVREALLAAQADDNEISLEGVTNTGSNGSVVRRPTPLSPMEQGAGLATTKAIDASIDGTGYGPPTRPVTAAIREEKDKARMRGRAAQPMVNNAGLVRRRPQ